MFLIIIIFLNQTRSISSACSSCKEHVRLAPHSSLCFRCFADIGNPPPQPPRLPVQSCIFCRFCKSESKSGELHCCICNAWHCEKCSQLNSQQLQDPLREPFVCNEHELIFCCPICQKDVAATRPCARCKSRFVCSACCKIGNGGYLCVVPDAENGGIAHYQSCAWCGACDSFQMETFTFYHDDCNSRRRKNSFFRLCNEHIPIFKAVFDALDFYLCADILTLIGNWIIKTC